MNPDSIGREAVQPGRGTLLMGFSPSVVLLRGRTEADHRRTPTSIGVTGKRLVTLAQGDCLGLNQYHLRDILAEREGLKLMPDCNRDRMVPFSLLCQCFSRRIVSHLSGKEHLTVVDLLGFAAKPTRTGWLGAETRTDCHVGAVSPGQLDQLWARLGRVSQAYDHGPLAAAGFSSQPG